MNQYLLRGLATLGVLLLTVGRAGAQRHGHAHHEGLPPEAPAGAPAGRAERLAPLLDGMGTHHHPITTASAEAQRFFDQGLVLAYGFNHAEAERSFREAARLDPSSAMPYWGIALVLGPHLNARMEADAVPKAYAALQEALRRAPGATAREQAYIQALAKRYTDDPSADRAALDSAYAAAMAEVAARFPDDPDAATLYAEALMDTTPWDYWEAGGRPRPVTRDVLAALASVMARHPDHPGALHFYIHAVEAAHPERAETAADRLIDLVPGAGHLVHMPAHIYLRIGRYHDAVVANEKAIAADRDYTAQCHAQGLYTVGLVPHNHHFYWVAATMAGMGAKALEAAVHMAASADTVLMRQPGYGTLQHYALSPYFALARFGRWDDVLRLPAPAPDLVYPAAMWHYVRGLALARTGRPDEAAQALRHVARAAGDPFLETVTIWDINTTGALVRIAREMLAGEIAAARGDTGEAVRRLRAAVALEDALRYDEPSPWSYPTRHALGAVLLEAGDAAGAEAAYRDDLRRNPANGWSLFGLAKSLRAQGKARQAEAVERRFAEAWAHADTRISASRF